MKIKVYPSIEHPGSYMYDIWLDAEADEAIIGPDDGGLYEGSYEETLEAAHDAAKVLLSQNNPK